MARAVERQTLLPNPGAIVFMIRMYLTPLTEFGLGEAWRLDTAIRGLNEQEVVCRSDYFFRSDGEPRRCHARVVG